MGAVGDVVGGFLGAKQPKPVEPVVAPVEAEPIKSPAEIEAEEEKRRRSALVAANAGGNQTNQLGVQGDASVTSRGILGL